MKLLTNGQQKSNSNAKFCYIFQLKFEDEDLKDKTYCKIRGHFLYTGEYIVSK